MGKEKMNNHEVEKLLRENLGCGMEGLIVKTPQRITSEEMIQCFDGYYRPQFVRVMDILQEHLQGLLFDVPVYYVEEYCMEHEGEVTELANEKEVERVAKEIAGEYEAYELYIKTMVNLGSCPTYMISAYF